MIYVILITYLAFTFWGSLIGVKMKSSTPESYFLANRNLGTISLFFTILATNFSAFYFLGFAGEGYKIGYAHYVIMALGTALASISFFIIGVKVWVLGKKNGYITPAELIYGETKDRRLGLLFSSVMIIFTLPYLSLQIIGGGFILENLTNGDVSYPLAVILLTVFTIVYVVIGGMESVAKTDLKQGLLMILFMFLAVFFISKELGGISKANQMTKSIMPELFDITGRNQHYTPQKWFSYLIFWIFCIPMFPQLFMRFYIARDLQKLRSSALLYAFIPLVISLFPVMIGVWGHINFPGLEGKEIDQILPKMLLLHTSEIFSAIVMTGAIAAFMSTLDSQLLAMSTMFTRDIYLPLRKLSISFDQEVRLGRILVVIFAIIGMVLAFKPFDTIFDMGKMAFSGLAILFPTAYFVTRKRIKRTIYLKIGILTSLAVLILFYYDLLPDYLAFGFEPFIICILLSFFIQYFSVENLMKTKKIIFK